MDSIRNLASSAGSAQEYLNGIQFPISKDNLVEQLQGKGASEHIVERVQGADLSTFENAQDVLSRVMG